MSEEIEAAEKLIEEALLAYSRAHGGEGEILTGWAVTATLTNGDLIGSDSTAYLRVTPASGQPFHVTIGLLTYHLDQLRHDQFEETA